MHVIGANSFFLVNNVSTRFPILVIHLTKMIDGSVHVVAKAVLSFKKEGYKKTDIHLKEVYNILSFLGLETS
ncbi:hypothetical protein [Virgibacillus ndiopensis]|uniref:hypothetical protein n=1 Tax=Virgibacillus ndiopensis TaxID=2004408 RepID=UPI000C0763E9|nr:hypothetical protein [Virgibacillus ndiopensis]